MKERNMRTLTQVVACTLTWLCVAGQAYAQTDTSIIPDVVYGHKDGMALTMDVFAPPGEANGAGILYMVSGGWVSWWTPPEQARSNFETLLSEGFTVFSIRHGSSPRFKVPEAYGDVRRAVRFVRVNARTYGVDPDRLGVWGGSAGGHLSLMLGLASDKGNPTAADEVLRESSRVAAVVAYFPPVDLRTRVASHDRFPPTYPDDALSLAGGIVRPDSHTPFPALDFDERLMSSVSPILHVSSDDPPTLLVHGDADSLVDVNNSRLMHTTLGGKGVVTDLVVIEGAGHGFQGEDATRATSLLVEWFSTHLAEAN
jgi:acetyl esterase/lipase